MPLSAHKHSSLFQSQICVRPHFPQNVSQQTDAEASIRIQLFAIKPDIRDLKTCETMPFSLWGKNYFSEKCECGHVILKRSHILKFVLISNIDDQWWAGKTSSLRRGGGGGAPSWSVCQFLWCKYSHTANFKLPTWYCRTQNWEEKCKTDFHSPVSAASNKPLVHIYLDIWRDK